MEQRLVIDERRRTMALQPIIKQQPSLWWQQAGQDSIAGGGACVSAGTPTCRGRTPQANATVRGLYTLPPATSVGARARNVWRCVLRWPAALGIVMLHEVMIRGP